MMIFTISVRSIPSNDKVCDASGAESSCKHSCEPPLEEIPAGICSTKKHKACCKVMCAGPGTLCLKQGVICDHFGFTLTAAWEPCKHHGVCCAWPTMPTNWPKGFMWPPYNEWPPEYQFPNMYRFPSTWPIGWDPIPDDAYPKGKKTIPSSQALRLQTETPIRYKTTPLSTTKPPVILTAKPPVQTTETRNNATKPQYDNNAPQHLTNVTPFPLDTTKYPAQTPPNPPPALPTEIPLTTPPNPPPSAPVDPQQNPWPSQDNPPDTANSRPPESPPESPNSTSAKAPKNPSKEKEEGEKF